MRNLLIQDLLKKTLIAGLTSILTFLLLTNITQFGRTTKDDLNKLVEKLEEYPKEQVLGVNSELEENTYSENLYGCPENKPIIGWIDFRGRKLIKTVLPKNQRASACFRSLEEAKEAGFDYKED